MISKIKKLSLLSISSLLLLLSGCAQITIGEPVATIDNIQKAKNIGMQPVTLGEFKPIEKEASWDKVISIRSNSVSSPIDGSFSEYLKASLAKELNAAGLLDPNSNIIIEGILIESDSLAPASGKGTAVLTAKFSVRQDTILLYDKELSVNASWESGFVGAIAIPAAINGYTELHRKLVGKLLDDQDFQQAVAKQSIAKHKAM